MHTILKNTVSNFKHFSEYEILRKLSWDDIKIFLQCAEAESFRKASKSIGMSPATVTRHIERLEELLEIPLFKKLPDGICLTPEGQNILEDAREIEQSLFNLVRKKISRECADVGEVTLSISEGIGTYWVMPRIIEFQRNYPSISLNMRCSMDRVDVLRMETDISIQYHRPENKDLVVTKLGRLHVYPFASHGYLNLYGIPRNHQDLKTHRFVHQVAPEIDETIFPAYFDVDIQNNIGMRTNSSITHYYAILNGAGIGVLPTYIYYDNSPISPIEIEIRQHHSLDIWMTYHPDIKKVSRKALVIDWLKNCFNPKQNPCFRDEFISPRELGALQYSFRNKTNDAYIKHLASNLEKG